jgi:TIR domain/SPOR domain
MPEAPLRILRLYLASVPGDMDGERAIIEGMVLPELRELAAKVGIRIELVDPAKEGDAPWDLARRFREIEACRPFFIALVGERYGEPPSAVPLEVVAAQPWLVEDTGRSLLELEIQHGVLHDPSAATGSFFYFRSPRFPSLVSGQHRAQFLAESPEAAERLSRLKDRIRASGRPVFDGYPCGWSDGLERVSRLDALAEQMLEDLWGAIQEQVGQPPEPIRVHLPPEKALPVHEEVQFTVYRPRAVEPLKWVPLLVFAHLSELPADAAPDERDPVEEVKAQAQRLLGDLAPKYGDVKQDSRYAVPHEAEITFLPEIPGFEVNPPRRTFLWLESVQREEFRIRAGPQVDGTLVRGRMTVFWGSILLAEISLGIRVDSRLAGVSVQPPPERTASRPFRGIFPSYSHRDAGIVEEFERYARTLGDRYLRDVHELRAGEIWNDRLKDLIGQADVFQLFWSWNAMRSPYVEEEWRYALSLGRPHFVRPTYWEDPLPELPERSLPPEELRRLHFQLLSTGTAPRITPHGAHGPAEPPTPASVSRGFDPNATILSFPSAPSPPEPDLDDTRVAAPAPVASAPPLDDTAVNTLPPLPMAPPPRPPLPPEVAAARPQLPPLPAGYGSAPASMGSERSGPRWLPFAAMIALAVVGLSVFLMRSAQSPQPSSTSTSQQQGGDTDLEDPDRVPVISVDLWPLMTRVCGLDETAERELPGRAQGGAPIVQVYSSINTAEAHGVLSRLRDRGAFLLPIEEDGRTFCTVALGPFPTLDAAREYALGLRRDGTAPEAELAYFPFFSR